MYPGLAIAVVLCFTQMPVGSVLKSTDIGPLAQAFTLVSAEAQPDYGSQGYLLTLKLRAIEDFDPTGADISLRAGLFDRDRLLLEAPVLAFNPAFPLLKGESVFVSCTFQTQLLGQFRAPWHRIRVREVKKGK